MTASGFFFLLLGPLGMFATGLVVYFFTEWQDRRADPRRPAE